MKPKFRGSPFYLLQSSLYLLDYIWSEWRRQKLPLYLFLAICFNLVVAPLVYAATGETLERTQAWALGLLGLTTVGLSTYLFFVMFVPEKF